MTPDEIAADRAVIDAAIDGPGPWTAPGYEVWAAFIAAARTGWPRALDALEAAQEGNDRLGALVEWLAEVIVDARDACQRAESIEPSGSPEWVESGIAMRTTALREVRTILDRERNAHPFGLSTRSAVAGNGEFAERAEKAEAAIARVRALIYASDDGTEYEHVPGCEGEPTCPACWAASIRQALAPVPFRALDRVAPMRAWGIDPGEAE